MEQKKAGIPCPQCEADPASAEEHDHRVREMYANTETLADGRAAIMLGALCREAFRQTACLAKVRRERHVHLASRMTPPAEAAAWSAPRVRSITGRSLEIILERSKDGDWDYWALSATIDVGRSGMYVKWTARESKKGEVPRPAKYVDGTGARYPDLRTQVPGAPFARRDACAVIRTVLDVLDRHEPFGAHYSGKLLHDFVNGRMRDQLSRRKMRVAPTSNEAPTANDDEKESA